MESPQLTVEAKEAIRSYVRTIFILPGILGGIAMFIFGYLINDVAKEKAYNDAYKPASAYILSLSESIYGLKTAAQNTHKFMTETQQKVIVTAEYIETVRKHLIRTQQEAIQIRDKLKTVESFQEADKLVESVSNSLVNRKDFLDNLVKTYSSKLDSVERSVSSLVYNTKNKFDEIDKLNKKFNDLNEEFMGYKALNQLNIPGEEGLAYLPPAPNLDEINKYLKLPDLSPNTLDLDEMNEHLKLPDLSPNTLDLDEMNEYLIQVPDVSSLSISDKTLGTIWKQNRNYLVGRTIDCPLWEIINCMGPLGQITEVGDDTITIKVNPEYREGPLMISPDKKFLTISPTNSKYFYYQVN